MKARHYNDTHAQALAYAEADRSDPFTYSRIMSHIANEEELFERVNGTYLFEPYYNGQLDIDYKVEKI